MSGVQDKKEIGKQCKPSPAALECEIRSGATLFLFNIWISVNES